MADYQQNNRKTQGRQQPPTDAKRPPRIDEVRTLVRKTMAPSIRMLLGKQADIERFAKVFLNTLEMANLIDCTDGSIARAMMHSAEVDLEVGGAYPFAYLIPYNNRDRNVREVQFQISVWGYLELVRRSKGVKKVWADVIYSNDVFETISGTSGKSIVHQPDWFAPRKERGTVLGSYACALLENGETVFEPVSKEELDQARAQNRGDSPAWDKWPEQQYQKVALKRLSKYLPKGDRTGRALEIDENPNTRPIIEVEGVEVPSDTPPANEPRQGPLDDAVKQEKARQAADDATPAQRLDRDRLFEMLCDADETWNAHRARVDAWDEIDALSVLAFLRAVLGGDVTAPPPACMTLPTRDVA